jgi:predicted metal-dependent hydrolase
MDVKRRFDRDFIIQEGIRRREHQQAIDLAEVARKELEEAKQSLKSQLEGVEQRERDLDLRCVSLYLRLSISD